MTSRRTPHIVSPPPGLPASADRCPANRAAPGPARALENERNDDAREEQWRTANYFQSLRKVGSDALVYQARE